MKDRLISFLGSIGGILYYLIFSIVGIMPLVMIGASFWVNLILLAIMMFIPISTVVFWVWGLICAIIGPQDFWAIIYYILFAVVFLPFFVSTLRSLFKR